MRCYATDITGAARDGPETMAGAHEEEGDMERREFLGATAGAAWHLAGRRRGVSRARQYSSRRPPPGERRFVSPAVERRIRQVRSTIADPELGWLFENCFPNTLDTTVQVGTLDGKPDTFLTF